MLAYTVPAGSVAGDTAARFRLSSDGNLDPTGSASDGEVEDYFVSIDDGGMSPNAHIRLVGVPATVEIVDSRFSVGIDSVSLFEAPTDSIAAAHISGDGRDDTITLAFQIGQPDPRGRIEHCRRRRNQPAHNRRRRCKSLI